MDIIGKVTKFGATQLLITHAITLSGPGLNICPCNKAHCLMEALNDTLECNSSNAKNPICFVS